jgi:hypothetical protein
MNPAAPPSKTAPVIKSRWCFSPGVALSPLESRPNPAKKSNRPRLVPAGLSQSTDGVVFDAVDGFWKLYRDIQEFLTRRVK